MPGALSGGWMRGHVIVALLALAAASCTVSVGSGPGTTTPAVGPPAIMSFSASRTVGPAPLTTAFTWSIPTPASSFTCSLDLDDDDVFEVSVPSCTHTSVRSATFDTPGSHPVRLRVTDGTSTVTSAPLVLNVGAASADGFELTLRYVSALTPTQQSAFESAAERWSEVVRTGLADINLNVPADQCGTGAPAFAGAVDDLLIDADVASIDGPGGILAQAGPCLVRTVGGLPVFGAMKFDSDDIAALEASGQFETVILHEMGHVLGFGTVWQSALQGAGTADPRFIGLVARGGWSALLGGSGVSVPVEGGGGPGTADAHWRESVFDNELMTGYIDPGSNPLSAITIGSLADIGYGVDLAAADPYGSPALRAAPGPGIDLQTELIHPSGQVD